VVESEEEIVMVVEPWAWILKAAPRSRRVRVGMRILVLRGRERGIKINYGRLLTK